MAAPVAVLQVETVVEIEMSLEDTTMSYNTRETHTQEINNNLYAVTIYISWVKKYL